MSVIAYGFSIPKENLDKIKSEKIKRMLLCFAVKSNNAFYPEAYEFDGTNVSKLNDFITVFDFASEPIDAEIIGSFCAKKGGKFFQILRKRLQDQGQKEEDIEEVRFFPVADKNALCFRFEINYNNDAEDIGDEEYYHPSPPAKPDDE